MATKRAQAAVMKAEMTAWSRITKFRVCTVAFAKVSLMMGCLMASEFILKTTARLSRFIKQQSEIKVYVPVE